MKSEDHTSTLHNIAFNEDEANKHHIVRNTRLREIQVTSKSFRANKVGEVTVKTGIKTLRMTVNNKRVLVKISTRTIPFGYRGPIMPI